jgi:hypothetical protein
LLVKRPYTLLNSAFSIAILDSISRLLCYRLSRRQFSWMPLSLNLVVGVISRSSPEGRLPAFRNCVKHLHISPTSPTVLFRLWVGWQWVPGSNCTCKWNVKSSGNIYCSRRNIRMRIIFKSVSLGMTSYFQGIFPCGK